MLKAGAIYILSKDTKHLPNSSFYLGAADICSKEAIEEFPKIHIREFRYNMIKEAEGYLYSALSLFDKDKKEYQEVQKKGFIERKICVDEALKKLQVLHIKMLIKELDIV